MAEAEDEEMPVDFSPSVLAAKRYADEAGPLIFSGLEALKEVGKPGGLWNWALVAAQPTTLPLSGGGPGSVEEMSTAIGKHAHSFGLLRLTFGIGPAAKHKWLFIHASDPIDSGHFTSRERGQAMGMQPLMHKAIYDIKGFSAIATIESTEECTVERMVEKLLTVSKGDAKETTVENFNLAVEAHKLEFPELARLERRRQSEAARARVLLAVAEEEAAAAALEDDAAEPTESEVPKLRKKMKLFQVGDKVEIFSLRTKKWMLDGEVCEAVAERTVINDFPVMAGSVRVFFANMTMSEWVAPGSSEEHLRPSGRPVNPAEKIGWLDKETHTWIAFSHARYTEVGRGFLRWWETEDQAKNGERSKGSIYLLGMQLHEAGTRLTLRSEVTQGTVLTFSAKSPEEAKPWANALWLNAGYCLAVARYNKKFGLDEDKLVADRHSNWQAPRAGATADEVAYMDLSTVSIPKEAPISSVRLARATARLN